MSQTIPLQGQSGEVVLLLLRQAQKPSRLSKGVAITFHGDSLIGQKRAADLNQGRQNIFNRSIDRLPILNPITQFGLKIFIPCNAKLVLFECAFIISANLINLYENEF